MIAEPAMDAASASRLRVALLHRWISLRAAPEGLKWLTGALAAAENSRELVRALALVPRRLGKGDLALSQDDLRDATAARPGFDPTGMSVDQACRIALLLASGRDGPAFRELLESVCRTADLGEFVAYYRGLPLFPAPELLVERAKEAIRSGIKPIFEAVAHRSPYPREMLDLSTWNQMVLKAVFIGSELNLIQGLDERANPDLAALLVDYAHERWSASRPVTPELWRCVGLFAEGPMLDDLARVLEEGDESERAAAALALQASPARSARALLSRNMEFKARVTSGEITWENIRTGGH
jgi:hypothetical protein